MLALPNLDAYAILESVSEQNLSKQAKAPGQLAGMEPFRSVPNHSGSASDVMYGPWPKSFVSVNRRCDLGHTNLRGNTLEPSFAPAYLHR